MSLAMVLVAAAAPVARAAPTELRADQRAQLRETVELIRQAGATYRAGDYESAGRRLSEAMRHLESALADADADVYQTAEPLVTRIERAHALLQLEGIVLPPFERPEHGASRPSHLEPAADQVPPNGDTSSDSSPPAASQPAEPAERQDAMASTPTGTESISFARHVAPLLVDNCNGCHIAAMQTRGGLRIDSFAQLMRGGNSGPVIDAGNGSRSLLVRKLRGEEGNRMPAGGREPLADEEIALISTWIDQGASFDGASPDQPLGVMMAQAWANNATSDELAERRRELARKNWQLGAPVEAREGMVEAENEAVFVIGNIRSDAAGRVAKAAVAAFKKVRTVVPPPPRGKGDSAAVPLRGRVTLFVFPRRYDYSEFSKMVESREIPVDWEAHWHYDGVDAYVSLVVAEDDPKAIEARLIGPLASLSLAPRGELPRWFSEGVGRAAAARLAARDLDWPRQWDAALPAAASGVQSPDQVTEGKLPPDQTDLIGYGIGKTMIDRGGRRQFDALLRNLDGGATFDQALTAAVGASPEAFITAWFQWYATQRRR